MFEFLTLTLFLYLVFILIVTTISILIAVVFIIGLRLLKTITDDKLCRLLIDLITGVVIIFLMFFAYSVVFCIVI